MIVIRRRTAIAAGAAALLGRSPASGAEADVVRVGYLPIYTDLPLFVAAERGLATARGLRLELTRFESSPLLGTALAGDRIDAATAIALSSALVVESSDPGRFRILFVDAPDTTNYFSSVVVRPDLPIASFAELRGRTIGIFPGPTAALYFGLVAKRFGLDLRRDATVVELAAATHVPALVGGQIDALMTYEPMATEAVMGHGMRRLLPAAIESQVISPWQSGVGIVATAFLTRAPAQGRRFAAALEEAIELIRAQPAEMRQLLHQYTGIDPAIAAHVPPMPFAKAAESDLAKLQFNVRLMREAGLLSRDIEVAKLMYAA
jgi:NitT/TauT family transport system substrate-binding protein